MLNWETLMLYVCDEILEHNLFIYGLVYILIWTQMVMNWSEKWAGCKMGLVFFHEQKLKWAIYANETKCRHVSITFHVIALSAVISSTMLIYMSSLLSTSLPYQQPRHTPCHQCVTWQLNPWRKLYCLWRLFSSWKMGLGWISGPGTFYDGFKTSWIKQSVTKF